MSGDSPTAALSGHKSLADCHREQKTWDDRQAATHRTRAEHAQGAFEFTKDFADRTDGKPTQKHEVSTPRTTIFKKDPDPAPPGL